MDKEKPKIPYLQYLGLKQASARRDSNPRPRPWQGRAPPTEPLAHLYCSITTFCDANNMYNTLSYIICQILFLIFLSKFHSPELMHQFSSCPIPYSLSGDSIITCSSGSTSTLSVTVCVSFLEEFTRSKRAEIPKYPPASIPRISTNSTI